MAGAARKRKRDEQAVVKRPLIHAGTRKERIARLVEKIEGQLDLQKMKVTLADFIRLTQLEREIEDEEQPREIIVTWKDGPEENGGSK